MTPCFIVVCWFQLLSPTLTQAPVARPADWSPDGSHLVFWSDWEGNFEVYSVRIDGSELTNLTNDPAEDANPVWSPDGSRIAFYSKRAGNGDVFVMNADGSGLTNLSDHPGPDHNPSWSPDGASIAFQSYRDGHGQIYVMRADGSDQRRISMNEYNDTNPDWSPDGKHILFVSDRLHRRSVFSMDANGRDQAEVASVDSADLLNPKWSPDGTWFTFHSHDSVNGVEYGGIYLARSDGSGIVTLTDESAYNFNPFVSPDGSRISFNTSRDGRISIWTMKVDGSDRRLVANGLR